MSGNERLAIGEEERVTRLYAARVKERPQNLAAAFIENAADPGRGERLWLAELEARLDEALEQKLLDPLSRIRTMAAVLNDEHNARQQEPLRAIQQASERAEGMLRDLLDFLRSAVGGLRVRRRRLDLKLLCERVIDAIHTSHPDRPMVFTSDPHVEGRWDPERMAMLVSKLVINAIEHGPARPAIRIELHAGPDEAVLQVRNAGAMAEGDSPARLFEAFVCGSSRAGAPSGGLGLGLYLAREIALAHGGRIEVQSSDAEGTTLRVTLPRG